MTYIISFSIFIVTLFFYNNFNVLLIWHIYLTYISLFFVLLFFLYYYEKIVLIIFITFILQFWFSWNIIEHYIYAFFYDPLTNIFLIFSSKFIVYLSIMYTLLQNI